MSDAELEEKVELYEHFFRDPRVGEGVLQPPREGIACRNIRDALRFLGYPLGIGNKYDQELMKTVLRFQTDHAHTSSDGLVGPGTRKRLTKAIIAHGEGFFKRGRISPEYAVFLSYSRKDEDRLADIIQGIQSCGIPLFRDKEAIPGGASWPDVLYRSIRKCQVFLCMLSPHSVDSINVLIEIALARHADRRIIPVMLQTVELKKAMRSLLEGIQHIDLTRLEEPATRLSAVLEALSMHGLSPQEHS